MVVLAMAGIAGPAAVAAQSPAASPGSASPAASCPAGTEEENEAAVEAYIAAVESGDEAAIDQALHEDFSHNLSRNGQEVPTEGHFQAGTEHAYTIHDIFGADDHVAVRFSFEVPAESVPDSDSTGPVEATALAVVRLECGQIREAWIESDVLTVLLEHGYELTAPNEN